MIKHIVMWKFKDSANGRTKEENIEYIISKLLALPAIIPQIKSMEIKKDVLKSERSFDVVLICDFESLDALSKYQVHPDHQNVSKYMAQVVEKRAAVDYEF